MFTASGAKRAFTLLEVMVASFLASIILYVLISLLIPSIRHSRLGATRVDLDQRAALLDARLTRCLKQTTRGGVGWQQDPAATYLSTHGLTGTGPDSMQTWSPSLDIFRWSDQENRIVHARLPRPQDVNPAAPIIPGLDQITTQFPSSPVVSVTEGVTSFTVIKDGGPRVDYEAILTVDKEKVRLFRTVFLVNSTQ
jgi:type II secretory pathway pseudopilin PulG